jgi:hypothetical protein
MKGVTVTVLVSSLGTSKPKYQDMTYAYNDAYLGTDDNGGSFKVRFYGQMARTTKLDARIAPGCLFINRARMERRRRRVTEQEDKDAPSSLVRIPRGFVGVVDTVDAMEMVETEVMTLREYILTIRHVPVAALTPEEDASVPNGKGKCGFVVRQIMRALRVPYTALVGKGKGARFHGIQPIKNCCGIPTDVVERLWGPLERDLNMA